MAYLLLSSPKLFCACPLLLRGSSPASMHTSREFAFSSYSMVVHSEDFKTFFIRCFGSLIFKVTSFSVSYTLIHLSDNVHVGSLLGLSRDSVASVHVGGGHRVKTYCVQEGRVGARHFQSDMGISVWFTVQPWNGRRCTRSK